MNDRNYIFPDDIRDLLTKYYNGDTSVEEERMLRQYFAENQVPEAYLSDKLLIASKQQDEHLIFPENELWSKIKEKDNHSEAIKKIFWQVSSIAASLALLVAIFSMYYYYSNKPSELSADTCRNPQEAYRLAQKYLGLVSNKLTYAYNEIKPIEKLTIPSDAMQPFSEINRSLEHLKPLNQINVPVNKLEHFTVLDDIIDLDKNL